MSRHVVAQAIGPHTGLVVSQENKAGMNTSCGNWMFTSLVCGEKGDLMPNTDSTLILPPMI